MIFVFLGVRRCGFMWGVGGLFGCVVIWCFGVCFLWVFCGSWFSELSLAYLVL